MATIQTLAAQLADERDVPTPEMTAIVEAYASQISDDPDLYDAETGEISNTGAELITTQIAEAALTSEASALDELMDAQAGIGQANDTTTAKFEARMRDDVSSDASGNVPRYGVWNKATNAWHGAEAGLPYITLTPEQAQLVARRRNRIDKVAHAQADVDQQDERLARRDAAIRSALSEGVPVREIVAHTGLSRERVYQIRDGRR